MAEKLEWGFDLTGFGTADKFKALLNRHGLTKFKKNVKRVAPMTKGEKGYVYYSFQWSRPDGKLKIITGNNPITGEYSMPKARELERGYASYIGIEGDKDNVLALKDDIKNITDDIKDESPNQRDFI
jgi:hypothetical protein